MWSKVKFAAIAVIMGLVGWGLAVALDDASDNAAELKDQKELIGDLKDDVGGLDKALDKANLKLVNAGEQPVAVPPTTSGPQGIPGLQGDTGPQGQAGPRGPIGPRGQTGPAGPPGSPGIDGKDGAAGEPGATGAEGPMGPAGPAGEAGPLGPQGPKGDDGEPGRGIASLSCDSATPFTLTVTYSDGTSETYICGPGQQ